MENLNIKLNTYKTQHINSHIAIIVVAVAISANHDFIVTNIIISIASLWQPFALIKINEQFCMASL